MCLLVPDRKHFENLKDLTKIGFDFDGYFSQIMITWWLFVNIIYHTKDQKTEGEHLC